jgi:hypothetical protein
MFRYELPPQYFYQSTKSLSPDYTIAQSIVALPNENIVEASERRVKTKVLFCIKY